MIEIVYFGTDEYAAQTLEALVNTRDFKIVMVVTQPDRPVGRNQEMIKSPVKMAAEKYGIEVIQPETLKTIATQRTYTPTAPLEGGAAYVPTVLPPADLNIVYRYGLIIPQHILDLPKKGTINIHPSLLPKYRGPSPIQTAIMNGETETGITIMLMDEKMDHGPILAQETFAIEADDTYHTLSARMTPRVNELLSQTIPRFLSGEINSKPQDDSAATFSKILSRDDGKIDWNKSADEIYNLYRGLTPWPGVWTMWRGKRLKLLSLKPSPTRGGTEGGVTITDGRLCVSCGNGSIEVLELQLEGKKAVDVKTFLQGYKNISGAKLT